MADDIYHCHRSGAEKTKSLPFVWFFIITKHNNVGGTTRSRQQPMQLHETGKSEERFCNRIQFGTERDIPWAARKLQRLSQTPFICLILPMFCCPCLKYLV